jgi:hypothetical protein
LLPEWALHATAAAPTFIVRRGALNSGNTCYLNASVQALLSCDAFVALLRYVSEVRDAARREHGACFCALPHNCAAFAQAKLSAGLPTLRSLAALAAAFPALTERADGGRTMFSSAPLDAADVFGTLLTSFDTPAGAPAAPPRQGRRATRRSTQQQDAHEFLDRLLDTAHAVRMRSLRCGDMV